MTVRVGVIGAGAIGREHIYRLTSVLAGADVVAVADVRPEAASEATRDLPQARALGSGEDVVADPRVDAVVVSSIGATHEQFVLASIAAGKPVFCEKPLAPESAACERIVAAEVQAGQRMTMVGFVRRFDHAYRDMKAAIDADRIGQPMLFHSAHRNPVTIPQLASTHGMITDSCVHDIDMARWLLSTEVAATQVFVPRKNSRSAPNQQDPLLVLLEMDNGVVVTVELGANATYGYDIRGEVVGETGSVELAETARVIVKSAGQFQGRVEPDWQTRFRRAYDDELQVWINDVTAGRMSGPSAWDGYAATVVTTATLQALDTGQRTPVQLIERPDLYR